MLIMLAAFSLVGSGRGQHAETDGHQISDSQKQMQNSGAQGDYSKYYEKYTKQPAAGSQSDGASPDYLRYYQRYMAHVHNKSKQEDWKKAYTKQYAQQYMRSGDKYMPQVRNKSNPEDWKKAFMEKYAGSYMLSTGVKPASAGGSQSDGASPDYARYYQSYMKSADKYMPQVKNKSNPDDWKKAFAGKYADKYMPQVKNKSNPEDWKKAYMKKFAGQYAKQYEKDQVQHHPKHAQGVADASNSKPGQSSAATPASAQSGKLTSEHTHNALASRMNSKIAAAPVASDNDNALVSHRKSNIAAAPVASDGDMPKQKATSEHDLTGNATNLAEAAGGASSSTKIAVIFVAVVAMGTVSFTVLRRHWRGTQEQGSVYLLVDDMA
jgi:hypothetical protein